MDHQLFLLLYRQLLPAFLILSLSVAAAAPAKLPGDCKPDSLKMRGVWIATVWNLDFGRHKSAASFIREFNELTANLVRRNFTAMIFQVRPANDAFYRSRLNPWSHCLTGTEDEGIPGFDPLKFMLDAAHKCGLEFHAWLNPYRVTSSTALDKNAYLQRLAPGNFARLHPEYVLDIPLANGKRQLILDPGEPEVIIFIVNTVREIIENYDVDAIHFDDYFYPYQGFGEPDKPTYEAYNPNALSLADWRRRNIDILVEMVSKTIRAHNRRKQGDIQFGISPFGIWANRTHCPEGSLSRGFESFYSQFADSRRWVLSAWVDYIAPQLYWSFDHKTAPYAALADWWSELVTDTGVKLYTGQAVYRLGSGGSWHNPEELAEQLRYNSGRKNISGSIFFSYRNLFRPENRVMETGVKKVFEILRKCKSAENNISGRADTPPVEGRE
ncbi:MAG: family 10 glycosylhydrolase [Victivallales bacterium]|nr:family 10 glycosylhydrolase [Victivallales bacterium]